MTKDKFLSTLRHVIRHQPKVPKKRIKPLGATTKARKVRSKLPTVKTMRNKCDKLLSPIIKLQHPECFLKGAQSCAFHSQVAHHHIKKSRSSALRYDLENLIPLCNACHMMLHQNESKWVLELIERKGIEWAQSLKAKDVMVKTDVHFYIEHHKRLEGIYKTLKPETFYQQERDY